MQATGNDPQFLVFAWFSITPYYHDAAHGILEQQHVKDSDVHVVLCHAVCSTVCGYPSRLP